MCQSNDPPEGLLLDFCHVKNTLEGTLLHFVDRKVTLEVYVLAQVLPVKHLHRFSALRRGSQTNCFLELQCNFLQNCHLHFKNMVENGASNRQLNQ